MNAFNGQAVANTPRGYVPPVRTEEEDEARSVAAMSGLEPKNENNLPSGEKHQRDMNGGGCCSAEQWDVMLDFLCVHTGLGRDTNEMRPETRQRLWSEMASLLNALGPASRSREGWRRYWQSHVAAARSRASGTAATDTSAASSGRGQPADPFELLEEDARVLSVVGDEVSLKISQGHVVQKRREHIHSGCNSPPLMPSSPTNAPTDKASLQRRTSYEALRQRGSPSAEKLTPATSASDEQMKPYSSSPKSSSLTSPELPSEESREQLSESQGQFAELKEQEEAAEAHFRSQVLRHLQQVENTAVRLQAVSDRQAHALNELTTMLQRVLRLLGGDRNRPTS